jgi:type II secretory pathway pseudopilin PulG
MLEAKTKIWISMKTKLSSHQSGIAVVLVVLLVAVASAVGVVGYLRIKDSQNSKAALAEQQTSIKRAQAAKALADEKALAAEQATEAADAVPATTTPTPTATTPAPTPTPKPTPTVATSNATAFTAANCTGEITVYVSNKAGAEASYQLPSNWKVVKTHASGTALQGLCKVGEGLVPEYVIIQDAYVKSSNLSPTKP